MFDLSSLAQIISDRTQSDGASSYTKTLLDSGTSRVAKKFGEEAIELIVAANSESDQAVIGEAADVLYHLLVVLQARSIPLQDVYLELAMRTSRSGHDEKLSRGK